MCVDCSPWWPVLLLSFWVTKHGCPRLGKVATVQRESIIRGLKSLCHMCIFCFLELHPAFCRLCTLYLEMLDTPLTTHSLHRGYRDTGKDCPQLHSHIFSTLCPKIHLLLLYAFLVESRGFGIGLQGLNLSSATAV